MDSIAKLVIFSKKLFSISKKRFFGKTATVFYETEAKCGITREDY